MHSAEKNLKKTSTNKGGGVGTRTILLCIIFSFYFLCSILEYKRSSNTKVYSYPKILNITYATFGNLQSNELRSVPSVSTSIADSKALLRREVLLKKIGDTCFKYRPQDFVNFRGIKQTLDSDCKSPFVLVNDGAGRLGNQICQVMSLWLFRKHFGMRILISSKTYSFLDKVFTNFTIPHKFTKCYEEKNKNSKTFNQMYSEFNKSINFIQQGRPYLSKFIKPFNYITGYPCSFHHFYRYRDELRSLFVFKPNLIENSKNNLMKALAKKKLNRSNTTLVSVHVRRTDYIKYLLGKYNANVPGKEYYLKAFDLFRRRFRSVVFVVLSDDKWWCKLYFKGPDIIFPGNGHISDPSFDFATLTLCDHHIIGFGSFGFTSAFLGRGLIAYDISENSSQINFNKNCICMDPAVFIPIL